ncbi:ABC transporter ATP-binding protein [Lacipirellula limnantheis]|uniref:Putative ABC transporter ATP-binding protein n=1 Tax=Lacipirellula limnantheis TaxID=2528024 RepID=A0A517U2V5_9BACT|nr:ABC transporter ATP-binding protein [Lacipirellula limnantheis]QDT74950.1 putative ABC transporter ATP-binding protein [Lacipirellula limnantheis]
MHPVASAAETRQVKKSFVTGEVTVEAVRGVTVAIHQGELTAIVGPSGCGKSSLLSMLGAIDTPTSGQVLVGGVDVATLNDYDRTLLRRRQIGFVFQAFNLMPTLSALENAALPLELDGLSQREAHERARAGLEQVGLGKRVDHLPSMLSGGEQQRVAVARALVTNPTLLLADEPTGNLDTAGGEQVMKLLRELVGKFGQTVVMVTHDSEIAAAADRVLRMRDGLIAHDHRPSAVVESTPVLTPAKPATAPKPTPHPSKHKTSKRRK